MQKVIRTGDKYIIKDKLSWGITKALMKSASLVCEKAKEIVPVRTGKLKGSIDFDYVKSEGDTYYIEMGSDLNYAGFVELGTVKQNPKPYLVPALQNSISEILNIIEKGITES